MTDSGLSDFKNLCLFLFSMLPSRWYIKCLEDAFVSVFMALVSSCQPNIAVVSRNTSINVTATFEAGEERQEVNSHSDKLW